MFYPQGSGSTTAFLGFHGFELAGAEPSQGSSQGSSQDPTWQKYPGEITSIQVFKGVSYPYNAESLTSVEETLFGNSLLLFTWCILIYTMYFKWQRGSNHDPLALGAIIIPTWPPSSPQSRRYIYIIDPLVQQLDKWYFWSFEISPIENFDDIQSGLLTLSITLRS